jgi:hypothetical protein
LGYNGYSSKRGDKKMVDLGITEKDFHTRWYLTGRKNILLQELADSLGDAEMYQVARELRTVVRELKEIEEKGKEIRKQCKQL